MFEHGSEPVRGLPGYLPDGERLLWQGAPAFRSLAVRCFHLTGLALYFALLVGWAAISTALHYGGPVAVALSVAKFGGLACVAMGVVALYTWLVARGTVYTITSRRIVVRLGVALPVTINLPFREIASAGLRQFTDGHGDISLEIRPEAARMSYILLWPHVRPWKLGRPQPVLLSLPDARGVSAILGRAVAAYAPAEVQVRVTVPMPQNAPAPVGSRAAAAA